MAAGFHCYFISLLVELQMMPQRPGGRLMLQMVGDPVVC